MKYEILIVAGEEIEQYGEIEAYLVRKGFAVQCVMFAKDAYKVLRNSPVNIVISDYYLPNVSGLKFLAKVKEIKPYVELIFLSKQAALLKAIEAMKEGAYDFYEFPVNKRLLLAVVEKAVEKQLLFFEKRELETRVRDPFNSGNIVGRSKALKNVIDIVKSVSQKNVNILITGETGTGKEMVANSIHYNSPRAGNPFIKVNCGAFNEGVLESELFGHEKGAFTGAITKRIGRFELANGGTLFLDEIGDVSPATQIKLLRVLQEKEFERVGGNETLKVDVRVIAATNKKLKDLIDNGRFREDLYYRLNVVNIEMPSLRERKDDIPVLVSHFISKINDEHGYEIIGLSKEAMQIFINYTWPGNVRELENAIESAMALAKRNFIEAKYLPSFLLVAQPGNSSFFQIPKNLSLQEMENELIRLTLVETRGNKTKAAKLLKVGLRTLQRKVNGQ